MAKVKSDPKPTDDYARMNAAVGDAVAVAGDTIDLTAPTPMPPPAETPTDEFELTASPPVVVTDDIGEALRHAKTTYSAEELYRALLRDIEAVLAEVVGGDLIVPWAYDVREAAKGVLAKLRAGTPVAE